MPPGRLGQRRPGHRPRLCRSPPPHPVRAGGSLPPRPSLHWIARSPLRPSHITLNWSAVRDRTHSHHPSHPPRRHPQRRRPLRPSWEPAYCCRSRRLSGGAGLSPPPRRFVDATRFPPAPAGRSRLQPPQHRHHDPRGQPRRQAGHPSAYRGHLGPHPPDPLRRGRLRLNRRSPSSGLALRSPLPARARCLV